jgi:class 3 adenylate cyclase
LQTEKGVIKSVISPLLLHREHRQGATQRTGMAKFLRIGVHHSNVSGYTSKAWSVRRIGPKVFLSWGAVEVRGAGHRRRIYWAASPQRKTVRCGTQARAIEYVKRAISRRLSHVYERLPESALIQRRLERPNAESQRALATILFVDIVHSTEKAARLGDRRWSEVMNHYYAAIRRELRIAHGKEVVTTGDGIVARFGRPEKAILCSVAIRNAVRTLGLEIRAGLHAGEYKLIGNEVVGLAIHIGARVAAKAGANEVLVSSTVRELITDPRFKFRERGMYILKGLPEKWRLYVVEH